MASFMCWLEEHDESDAREVLAADAEGAAEVFAKWRDSWTGEYSIVGGTPAVVCVKEEGGEIGRFEVTGEPEPTYWAAQLAPLESNALAHSEPQT